MKMFSLKRLHYLGPVLAFAFPATLSAQTSFLGGDILTAGNWDNGLPSSGNPGSVAVDGTHYSTIIGFGNGSVVAQTAGIIDCGPNGFNLHNGGDWNMSGGAVDCRYFLPNGGGGNSVFNLSGGKITLGDHTGAQHAGVDNGGVLNISGSGVIDATEADQAPGTNGTMDIASDWTGSWTQGTYTIGNEWEGHFTAGEITYAGMTIDAATFAATFTVTDGGKTLQRDLEPGAGYCFGDLGSGAPCPCGNDNDGSVPESGCANGVFASGAQLTGSGEASLSADTLVLATTGLEPSNSGLYFQANNDLSPGLLWGDGLQCAGGQLKRLGVRFSDGTGYSDTSGYPQPISVKAGNITAGDTKYYQCWYRNPAASPCGTDFNASNGYAVTWVL